YLCQSSRSCWREAHRVAAPVLRGASALDEVRGFEVVEQADQVGAVDSQRLGEVGLALLSHEVQKRERDDVARAQVEALDLRFRLGADAPCNQLQQGSRMSPRLQDDGQLGHRGGVQRIRIV